MAVLENEIAATLTDDFWSITLPNNLATAGARSPYLLAYLASLNVLDARALFSKEKIADLVVPGVMPKKAPVERHHLFPKNYLASIGTTDTTDQNQIANLAIVGWEVNNDISDDAPAEYWPRWVEKFGSDRAELERMSRWHALPAGWQLMDYSTFLAARRQMMASVIRDGYARLM